MEAKASYTVVGITVIVLTATLLTFTVWISAGLQHKKYNVYAVYMHEAVSGLSEESTVKYNGVPVGNVLKISLSRVDPQEVKILLNIVDGTPITTSTTATLIAQGITGNTYIGLAATSADLTPLKKRPEEPYPIIPARPSLLHQLEGILKEVGDNVNIVSKRLQNIFNQENAKNLRNTLDNLERFTKALADNDPAIRRSLKNADIVLKKIAEVSHSFPETIQAFRRAMRSFDEASQSVTSTMHDGKATLNKLAPPANVLLRNLDTISANLEKVSNELRRNPSVIFRGTRPPAPGPGE